ncbi:MAG: hypothetical protein K9J83_04155 [Desulfarculaceae bacterium]|nr:hypothetical protein [Desulfarculaceae bacterium]
MNFKAKIFLATLSILITTLLLNSVMSIFSFEKNYVSSLISTYEVAGGALKRKIEQSLKLGKPLDKFQGMDRLFENMAEQNPHISMIRIEGKNGKVLYEYGERMPEGSLEDTGQGNYPEEGQGIETVPADNRYLTRIPLEDADGIVGRLYLSFPEKVIFEKVKQMVISNLNILWPVLVSTCFGLIFFLALLIFRPLKKELADISGLFEDRTLPESDSFPPAGSELSNRLFEETDRENSDNALMNPDPYTAGFDVRQVRSEMDMLKNQIEWFIRHYTASMEKIERLNRQQREVFDLARELEQCGMELEKMKTDENRLSIQSLIEEIGYIREMLSLIREIAGGMDDVCGRNPVRMPDGERENG